MLKTLLLAPGRLVAKLLVQDKKRSYRSVRNKPAAGPGTVLISAVFWVLILALVMVAVDKSGLLKQALDAGVEVAQNVSTLPEDGEQTVTGTESETAAPAAEGQAAAPGAAPSLSGQLNTPAEGPIMEAPPASATEIEGVERWLVILHTIPKSARDEAERRQSQYRNRGLQVEIMDTDAFPRLLGGNWIIAQGPFEDRASALAAADKAREFNSGLMVRRGL